MKATIFQRLMLLLLVAIGISSQTIAAPVYEDTGATQIVKATVPDVMMAIASFSSDMIPLCSLPGIVVNNSNNNSGNDVATKNGGFLPRPGHAGARTKPNMVVLNYYYGRNTDKSIVPAQPILPNEDLTMVVSSADDASLMHDSIQCGYNNIMNSGAISSAQPDYNQRC